MPRVAVIGDSHFDESSRFEECIHVHNWIADDIEARGVDLVLHSGDIFERKSTPLERQAVAAWIRRVTEHAPLIIVRGNHDALHDLSIFAKLETRHPVVVEEAAGVYVLGNVVVGCMAWPTKASALAMGTQSHAEGELLAGEALRNVLRGMGEQLAEFANDGQPRDPTKFRKYPVVLLGHVMVRGSVTSTGQPLVGCDLELGVEDLALAGADFYALGHIHKSQSWTRDGDVPFVYPGSPRRTAFGEVEEKGYLIVDFDDFTHRPTWSLIPTPCAPMLMVNAQWHAEHVGLPGDVIVPAGLHFDEPPEVVTGAEIRLRYHVDADHRDAAKAAAEAWKRSVLDAGALACKVEETVRSVNTARAPEVARALTLKEKLRAYWAARGTTPDEDRAEKLFDKVHELEVA